MNVAMAAHPTTYRGVNFRSRLEARWAAFFDLAGWHWEYEPTDHSGWTPDFVLIGKHDLVKVEVKPIEWCGDDRAMASEVLGRDDLKKVRSYVASLGATDNDWPFPDILILGCYPHFADFGLSGVCLGAFLSEQWGNSTVDIAVIAGGYKPQQIDFHAFHGSYGYRMGGQRMAMAISSRLIRTLCIICGRELETLPGGSPNECHRVSSGIFPGNAGRCLSNCAPQCR